MHMTIVPQTRRLRAMVFSNFPGQFFEKNLLPRFDKVNVDVVRVVHVDKSKVVDIDKSIDILIAMVELMSTGQRSLVKDMAKKHGKYYLGLSRQGDWQKYLSTIPVPVVTPQPPVRLKGLASLKALPPIPPALPAPPPEPAEPSPKALQELLDLYEEENSELIEVKKKLEGTLKEREDAILKHASDASALAGSCHALEGRLEDQIKVRAHLEEELEKGQHYVTGIERQLEDAKKKLEAAQRELETRQAPPEDASAALKAVNTKLKNQIKELERTLQQEKLAHNTVRQQYHDEVEARKKLEQRQPRAIVAPLSDKALLLDWSRALRQVQTGDASGYPKLLEIAAQYGLDIPAVLAIIK